MKKICLTQTAFSWLGLYLAYNFVFFGLQLTFILTNHGHFIQLIALPRIIYIELFVTLFTHLGLYLVLSLAQAMLFWGVSQRIGAETNHWHLIIWCLSICALLCLNAYYFPLSTFSKILLPLLPQLVITALMWVSLSIIALLTINLLLVLKPPHYLVLTSLITSIIGLEYYLSPPPITPIHHTTKPNIIILGVDSLDPNQITNGNMPFLTGFLKNSVYFKETITPLANTYPSWTSILTGLYPHHHHANYNLLDASQVQSQRSIIWQLKKAGYTAWFATDDRRFNNIDHQFGFDSILGPKASVNDFLLGDYNDFPLSNLFSLVSLGQILFPYNYLNRASYFLYYPQQFDQFLQKSLETKLTNTPLFFAVHFTLPHWPYIWAQSEPKEAWQNYLYDDNTPLYKKALQQTDKQVAKILQYLQQYGYLDNCILFVLSDHGEALNQPGSRQTQLKNYQGNGQSNLINYLKTKSLPVLDKSMGHGSDILSANQYRSLLAVQIYKNATLVSPKKTINTRVVLFDVAPTIMDWLNLTLKKPVDGISLISAILTNNPVPKRAFFMESGMLPNEMINQEVAKRLAKKYFFVNSLGQLRIKIGTLGEINRFKLYAIIQDDWLFALYPYQDRYVPVTLRLSDRYWDDHLNSEFTHAAPAREMLKNLRQFYQKPFQLVTTA